jgi:hypothetical protein
MNAPHRIRRQTWQVTVPDAASALAIRQCLRVAHDSQLLPVLDSALNAVAEGRNLHLPRLELRLRVSHPERLADELPGLLADAARQALAEVIDAASVEEAGAASSLSRLQHYLLHGDLPWADAHRPAADLRSELMAETAAWSVEPDNAWSALMAALPSEAPARLAALQRWLPLLDAADRSRWLAAAAERAAGFGPAAAEALRHLLAVSSGPVRDRLRDGLHALALVLADGPFPVAWSAAIATGLTRLVDAPGIPAELDQIRRQIEGALTDLDLVSGDGGGGGGGGGGEDGSAGDGTVGGWGGNRNDGAPAAATESRQAIDLASNLPVPLGLGLGLGITRALDSPLGQPLRSTGLILLHPWLPRLFANLGWVVESPPAGDPFPWSQLPEALTLLHWLVTGRADPLEFELGTAKLLLGLDPTAALPIQPGRLDEAALEEGGALLDALIAHWPALGSTSRDGLRVAFLQRDGLLYRQESGWLLRPQPKTYDLLLDRLSWSIRLILAPWHRQPLHVEWGEP